MVVIHCGWSGRRVKIRGLVHHRAAYAFKMHFLIGAYRIFHGGGVGIGQQGFFCQHHPYVPHMVGKVVVVNQFVLRCCCTGHKPHPAFGVQYVLQPQGVPKMGLQGGMGVCLGFIYKTIGVKTCGGDIACEVAARPWYAYPVFLYPLAQLAAGGIIPVFNIACGGYVFVVG
jgi:hypothetical protein